MINMARAILRSEQRLGVYSMAAWLHKEVYGVVLLSY
jgi:hypothetical protein